MENIRNCPLCNKVGQEAYIDGYNKALEVFKEQITNIKPKPIIFQVGDTSEQIQKAIDLAVQYGQIDGGHHKMWVIDQMVRILSGDKYSEVVREACEGEDGPNTYDWDAGTAP